MSHVLTRPITADEFLARGEDDERLELVNGRLERRMAPYVDHSHDQGLLVTELGLYARGRQRDALVLPELDIVISEDTVRVADVAYYAPKDRDRAPLLPRRPVGPPTLVIERVSASDEERDYESKLRDYARAGIPHYWIVDRERHTVETYELEGDAYRLVARFGRGEALTSPLLPGFSLPLAELFVE